MSGTVPRGARFGRTALAIDFFRNILYIIGIRVAFVLSYLNSRYAD